MMSDSDDSGSEAIAKIADQFQDDINAAIKNAIERLIVEWQADRLTDTEFRVGQMALLGDIQRWAAVHFNLHIERKPPWPIERWERFARHLALELTNKEKFTPLYYPLASNPADSLTPEDKAMLTVYETLYNKDGEERQAFYVPWTDVERLLGHPHDGSPEDDQTLRRAIHTLDGCPDWVDDAEGWMDERGWGLIGPTMNT